MLCSVQRGLFLDFIILLPICRGYNKYGPGNRHNADERLIKFCVANDLFVTNTFCSQPKRGRYTWISPDEQYRHQIDYILCSKRWRSAVHGTKTLRGADCGRDYQLLISKIQIKLKKKNNNFQAPARFNVEERTTEFAVEVYTKFAGLVHDKRYPAELWEDVRDFVEEAANKHIQKRQFPKRAKWLSKETINVAKERRIAKAMGDL